MIKAFISSLGLLNSPVGQEPENWAPVIMLTGQSNMNSQAPRSGLPSAYLGPFSNVKIWWSGGVNLQHSGLFTGRIWQDLEDGINQNVENLTLYMGTCQAIAKRWTELYPGKTLYIINAPKGATQLALSETTFDWNAGNPSLLWSLMNYHVKPGLQALIDLGLNPYILCDAWHQGEADAFGESTTYQSDYAGRSAYIDNEMGIAGVFRTVGSLIVTTGTHPGADTINADLLAIAAVSSNIEHIDLSGQGNIGDNVHLDQAGVIFHGEEIVNKVFAKGGFGVPYNPNFSTFPFVVDNTYDFTGETVDTLPVNTTEWDGTWLVKNHASLGLSVEPQTGDTVPTAGGDWATLRLNDVPLTQKNMEVRFKIRLDTTATGRFGVLLRATQGTTNTVGYFMQINPVNNFVSLGELRDGAATFIYRNFSKTINANTNYWFRFRIHNTRLILWVSDNGVDWTMILSEFKSTYQEGSVALTAGHNNTIVQGVFFDDIQIDLF